MGKSKTNVRLFQPAVMTGFRRSQRHQTQHTSLLKIKNVQTKDDTEFYCGKRVAYVFKAKTKANHTRSAQNPKMKSRVRVMWGRVTRSHGNNGAVRAKFSPNLPAQALGKKVRVYMYPSRI